jgi:hypothetical protein
MANLKISQLTATTQNTIGSWVVINNSGETVSNKSQLEYVLGLTKGSGTSSMKSADFLTAIPSVATSDYSIVLGNAASGTTAPSQVIIGNGAYSVSEGTVVIGKNAHDQGAGRDNGIAIGTDAEIYQPRAISIGKNAGAVTDSIALGTDSRAIANTSIAIGSSIIVAGDFGVGIGYDSFQDRSNATVIGTQSHVSGLDSTIVGASNGLGQNGGDSEKSVVIGVSNQIFGPYDRAIAIGVGNTIKSDGTIVISSAGISGLESSNNSTIIGTSGLTITSNFGANNVMVGGLNNSILQPVTKTTIIGGENNNFSGVSNNIVCLGISNKTIVSTSGFTLTENLKSYGQIAQGVQSLGSGDTFNIDWKLGGIVQMTLTGNSTCSMSNIENGASYNVYLTTTGTQTLTPSASGYTFQFEGGGFTLTTNGTDLCVLDVVGTIIYVRHFADFS